MDASLSGLLKNMTFISLCRFCFSLGLINAQKTLFEIKIEVYDTFSKIFVKVFHLFCAEFCFSIIIYIGIFGERHIKPL